MMTLKTHDDFQQDASLYEQVCLFGLALFNLKGTLKHIQSLIRFNRKAG